MFKPQNSINSFKPKTTEKAETTTSTTTIKSTTSRPRLGSGGFKPRPHKGQTVRDLLSSIPKDDLGGLLPKNFNNKKPPRTFNKGLDTSSIKTDDVSAFLPPGFKYEESTTSTTTDTSLIDDILSSIEQDDLAKLLPKDFGPLPDFTKKSRPKPPRLFQKTSESSSAATKASSASTTEKSSLIDSLKFDDVSSFLPPGFNPGAVEEEPEVSKTTKKPDFKLDLSSLFDDIKTDDVGDLLPPDFHKPASTRAPTTASESTTEKIVLKFPTRPGATGTRLETATKSTGIKGPPPFVPKIKSFAER